MPTFSRNLEQSLHRALALANERHHEYATLEHLLLALIDDQDAAAVMRACNVDLDKLRRSLGAYLESELENLVNDGNDDSRPAQGAYITRTPGQASDSMKCRLGKACLASERVPFADTAASIAGIYSSRSISARKTKIATSSLKACSRVCWSV